MRTTSIVILTLVALIVGYFVGLFVRAGMPWSEGATFFSIITAAGAFGGMLYTVRDSGLEFAHFDPDNKHVLRLGWVADCAYGIGGAYVVFLLLPTDIISSGEGVGTLLTSGSILGFIKLLALALVGGYGGRSLVDRALANIARRMDEVEKTAEEAKKEFSQIQETDTQALEIVHRHLDKDDEEQDLATLKKLVKSASKSARYEIFKEGRAARKQSWKDKNWTLMERTIPVFEALIENKAGEEYHRNHGQLGYALKDRGGPNSPENDFQRAFDELTTAIELRDQKKAKGFLMYELNRAICGIELGMAADFIQRDLQSAARNSTLKELMKKEIEPILEWAEKHNFDLDKLR